jgi:hypothetical protein
MVLSIRRALLGATLLAALPWVAHAQERGWLGFTVDSTSRVLVVRRVAPGSPASRAGLMRGDTIVSIDNITNRAAQLDRIRELEDGMSVAMQVRRGRSSMPLTLVARPAAAALLQDFAWNDSALMRAYNFQIDSVSWTLRRLLDTARVQSDAKWLLRSQDSLFRWGFRDSLFTGYRFATFGDSGVWNDAFFSTTQRTVSGAEVTPLESPLWLSLESWVARLEPGARLAPICGSGFTDSHYLRQSLGTCAYGFFPLKAMAVELAAALAHSADERIAIDDLELGVDMFRHVATTVAAER